MAFTLKIIEDKEAGFLTSDSRSVYGGIDLIQKLAFEHLAGSSKCPWVYREVLFELAYLHNWSVEITHI